jgi:hypothetical protein
MLDASKRAPRSLSSRYESPISSFSPVSFRFSSRRRSRPSRAQSNLIPLSPWFIVREASRAKPEEEEKKKYGSRARKKCGREYIYPRSIRFV